MIFLNTPKGDSNGFIKRRFFGFGRVEMHRADFGFWRSTFENRLTVENKNRLTVDFYQNFFGFLPRSKNVLLPKSFLSGN